MGITMSMSTTTGEGPVHVRADLTRVKRWNRRVISTTTSTTTTAAHHGLLLVRDAVDKWGLMKEHMLGH